MGGRGLLIMTKTKGTKEWADSNVNCYYGCSNNCRYCYARFMAFRFKRIEKDEDWKIMKPNQKAINKNYRKRKGRIMFPTSHDITSDPEVRENCFKVLKKMVKAGNNILLTTKPNLTTIQIITFIFKKYKEQIQFRFTITSLDEGTLSFFEPNAPTFIERFRSLQLAFQMGWKTSVSIEPFLDKDPIFLIKYVAPYCTESIWLGSMSNLNKVIARSIWEIQQIPRNPTQKHKKVQEIRSYMEYIHEANQISNIRMIVEEIKTLPIEIRSKIRLKDSIVNQLQLKRNYL